MRIPRLSKLSPRVDPRTLRLADYVPPAPRPVPDAWDWADKVTDLGMMDNDRLGCCTIAAAGHLIQAWTANNDEQVILTDEVIEQEYAAVSGYNGDPSTDTGCVELDVLNHWRLPGIGGHQLGAFAAIDRAKPDDVKRAAYLFEGVYIGVALPLSAQGQAAWDVPAGGLAGSGAPGSWGGHAVCVVAYDAAGLTVVTWGALLKMTWGFWDAYCDEAYALLSQDQLLNGVDPLHFDLAGMQADLAAATAEPGIASGAT